MHQNAGGAAPALSTCVPAADTVITDAVWAELILPTGLQEMAINPGVTGYSYPIDGPC